jgi:uncharacterized protein (DUF427 family)
MEGKATYWVFGQATGVCDAAWSYEAPKEAAKDITAMLRSIRR